MPLHDLSNKVVLLTGIGSVGQGDGNGTTIALLFARQGAVVFGCDINLDAANNAVTRIKNDTEAAEHPSRTSPSFVQAYQHALVCSLFTHHSH